MRRLLHVGNCLDLGCGTGRLLEEARSESNIGMDLSMGMLRKANRQIRVCAADAHHLPFADASFSSIVASNGVFRYLRDDDAFGECYRVLKPGGQLAVHQYSQRTWSIRSVISGGGAINEKHISALSDLTSPAEEAGFRTKDAWLWRPVRVFPFVLPIPQALPGDLWGHAVALFEKGGVH